MHQSENIKIILITIINKDEHSWLILLYARVNDNRSPSQTPRGRGNRQIQTSTNRTNVRKALRLALFPNRGNRNAKRAEKHKIKVTQGKTKQIAL